MKQIVKNVMVDSVEFDSQSKIPVLIYVTIGFSATHIMYIARALLEGCKLTEIILYIVLDQIEQKKEK